MSLTVSYDLSRTQYPGPTTDSWGATINSNDVISFSITGRGITNNEPQNRLGQIATLRMVLNNSAANSQGELGYYYDGRTSYFVAGSKLRITFTDGTYTKIYRFYIADIVPVAGKYGSRQTIITAYCWMSKLYAEKFAQVTTVSNKSGPLIINEIVSNMTFPPKDWVYDAGLENYAVALHDMQDNKSMKSAGVNNVLKSDFGYVLLLLDSSYGEQLRYFSRAHFSGFADGQQDVTFSETMTALSFGGYGSKYHDKVYLDSTPAKTGASNVVLWSPDIDIKLSPGRSTSIEIYYTDPSTGKRISAADVVTPVVTTDYTMGSTSGGTDLNASLGITSITKGANSTTITIKNNASVKGYVWLQLRGLPVTFYDRIGTTTSSLPEDFYSGPTLRLDYDSINFHSPYWSSKEHLSHMSNLILKETRQNLTVNYLEFWATKDSTFLQNWLTTDLGGRIKATETIKDNYFSSYKDRFYLMGEDLYFSNKHLKVRWYLKNAIHDFWVRDTDAITGTLVEDENGEYIFGEEELWTLSSTFVPD